MMQQQQQLQMIQQLMHNWGMMGMGMNPFQINLQESDKVKQDLIKIKKYLSKLYDEKMYLLVDIIFDYIKRKIIQLKKPNSDYPIDIIKINFYGTILEIKLYDNFYISGLIEYIYDAIFGEIQEEIIFGERKYGYQTTEEIIIKPRREIKKIRKNDYFRYLFLEYKGRDLIELKYKTCKDVGIKNDSELILKFIESISNEQNEICINNNNRIDINNNKEKIDEHKKVISDKKDENDNDKVNIKKKKNIFNKSHNYEHYSNSDNSPKVNDVFKKNSKICTIIIEPDKSIKDLINKYCDRIVEESDYFLKRYQLIYSSEPLSRHLDKRV